MLLRDEIILRYGFVGLFNTLLTVAVITALTFLGANLFLANALGYAAGLCSSYLGNRFFTFRAKERNAIWQFLLGFAIAYAANILVVYFVSAFTNVHDLISQFTGMVTYNVAFFLLMKTWIFKRD